MHFASDRVRLFRARTGTPTRDSKYEGAPLQVLACERLPELRNLRHCLGPKYGRVELEVDFKIDFRFRAGNRCDLISLLSRQRTGGSIAHFVSSAARAASAGDVVRPRVTRGGFSAFIMSSAERCSAAKANPEERAKPTAKVTPANPILRLLKTMDFLSGLRSDLRRPPGGPSRVGGSGDNPLLSVSKSPDGSSVRQPSRQASAVAA